jgi:hypothetical protein
VKKAGASARLIAAAALLTAGAQAQQVADGDYLPAISAPAYAPGEGPTVCVDEAHHNFHTLGGRFAAFGKLLERDGYRVVASTRRWDDGRGPAGCDVLVISNAQPSDTDWNDYPYPTPSAFTDEEIAAIESWVERGGRLLLIADHMPLAGAAAKLALAFDVEFSDGFARREPETSDPDKFSRDAGTLADHPITRGRTPAEAVNSIRTFTGQAFTAPNAVPLIVLPDGFVNYTPRKAWEFTKDTPRMSAAGWLQGAVLDVGKGRAAFFGEAAMFSAQLAGPDKRPMGMNAPGAERNFQFTLNVLHWLTEKR